MVGEMWEDSLEQKGRMKEKGWGEERRGEGVEEEKNATVERRDDEAGRR